MSRVLRVPTAFPFQAFSGAQRQFHIAAPAAGSEWSFTLPGGAWWRFISGISSCVTSAAAGNRNFGLRYTLGGVPTAQFHVAVSVAAGASIVINYGGNVQIMAGFPAIFVQIGYAFPIFQGGSNFGSNTIGLMAGDQYGAVDLFFEEIYTGPEGEPYGMSDMRDWTPAQRFDVAEGE